MTVQEEPTPATLDDVLAALVALTAEVRKVGAYLERRDKIQRDALSLANFRAM